MTEQEKLHIKAAEFANKYREEMVENRKNLGEKPLTHSELQAIWLNLYDGFKAGHTQSAILECITIAWNAPDGWDIPYRIADGMGYVIVEDGETIRLEAKDE